MGKSNTSAHPCAVFVEQDNSTDSNGMNMLLEAIASIDSITNDHIRSILPRSGLTYGTKNTHYHYTSVHGYDLCSSCGKKVALTKDGAVRKHRCIKKEETYIYDNKVCDQ